MKTEVEIEPLKPRIAGSHQEMEEGRKNSSLEASGSTALLTLLFQTSNLQNCDDNFRLLEATLM